MSNEQSVNIAFDIPAIRANFAILNEEIAKAKAAIIELNNLQAGFAAGRGGSAASASANAAANSARTALSEVAKLQERLNRLQTEEAKVIADLRVQINARNAELRDEAKIRTGLAGAYGELQQKLKDQTKAYNDLAAAHGLENAQVREAQRLAGETRRQLSLIDQGIGNYSRNVGNYASATNGLGFAMRNITSELPNLGISLRTFAQSLSNNIQPLQQAISQVNAQNAELRASGQPTVSVLRQLGQSFFSWGTLVSLAVVAGLKFIEYLDKEKKAAKEAAESQNALSKARKEAVDSDLNNLAKETTALEVLYRTATDVNAAYKTREHAVKELQKIYPAYFNDLTTEAFLAGKAADAYKELANAIVIKSEITAAENELEIIAKQVREVEKRRDIEKQANDLLDSVNKEEDQRRGRAIDRSMQENRSQKELNGLLSDRDKIIDEILKKQNMIPKLLVDNEARDPKKIRERNKQLASDTGDVITSLFDQLSVIENKMVETRDQNLRGLLASLNQGLISVKEYEDQKRIIVKKSEDDILNEQIKYLQYRLEAIGLSAENQQKVMQKITEMTTAEQKKSFEATEAEVKTSATNLAGFQAAMYKNKADADKKAADDEKKLTKEKYKYINAIAQESAQLIFQLLQQQTQANIAALEKDKETTAETYDKKIAAVERSTETEDEKTAQKLVLIAEEKEAQRQLDEQIRQQRRKAAELEKVQALATIAINTAVALASAQNLGLLGALSPFIIGLGAIQAATVLATPIPEYAEGKDASDSYTGKMLWGEAGTEMKIDKHGKIEVATSPTIGYTKPGDRIFSNDELKSMATGQMPDSMINDFGLLIRANASQLESQKRSDRQNTDRVIEAVFTAAKMNQSSYLQNAARA